MCPDSRRFILNQLSPTYDKLGQYMDIDLIPYGNANVSYPNHDFKPYFQCQHGHDECYGNRAQACVIDLTKSTRPSLNYVRCMFAADNWKETRVTAQKVSTSVGLFMAFIRALRLESIPAFVTIILSPIPRVCTDSVLLRRRWLGFSSSAFMANKANKKC